MTRFQAPLSFEHHLREFQDSIPASIRVVAVTKNKSVEVIRRAYAAGFRDFGESRVQEAIAKQDQLQDLPDIIWHLIGHLQSNKASKAVEHFTWIHSVDSLKLAKRLNQAATDLLKRPQICLQVKLRADPDKYGWEPQALLEDLPTLDQLSFLNIVGLMAIPPLGLSPAETLQCFQDAATLAHHIQSQVWQHLAINELSMGMSEDYELAIQAGATLIRPGRKLFGDRA
ncbi:MAG: YggS family pyridoxal phosphate-dependent enzyme [Elainellaceae cyanobacterium]